MENNLEYEKSLFFEYLDIYLKKRNIDSLKKLLSPSITCFGTGIHEKSKNFEKTLELYRQDILDIPSSIEYEIKSLNINKPADNVFIVWSEFDIEAFVHNHKLRLNNLRLTLVWIKYENNWLIEHMHISLPTNVHEEGEAFPIKEIEDQNKVLKRLLEEQTKDLNKALSEIRVQAITDRLTQIFNRIKIEEVLREELERAKRYNTKFSVIMMDIDHFKRVNDDFGHIVGDKFLIEFVNLVLKRIRKTDYFGRWGGEEFIIVCPNTSLRKALILAENLRKIVEDHNFNMVGHRTVSIGVSVFTAKDTVESIINKADKALYEAKNKGRNKVCAAKYTQ
ncbi:MAG: diguanylate cyclase [Thermodesulfovibrio sp.]|nr:diguanylate cyclase [Thermodesulfovibrio sp.]